MRIELKNSTQFRDDDLRAIMKMACKQAGVAAKRVVFVVRPGKIHIRGRATLPYARTALIWGTCRMSIPHFAVWVPVRHGQREKTEREWVREICQVALHEAMHLAGVRHRDMTEEQYHCCVPVPWADSLTLRIVDADLPETREARMAAARCDRLEHARAMLAKAITRRKRATTIEKKWTRRVKLMEKS